MECHSFIENLPEDLWEEILLNLNYDEILSLCITKSEIENYCENNNILEKRKLKGYPRLSGHCAAHDVSHFSELIPEFNNLFADDFNRSNPNGQIMARADAIDQLDPTDETDGPKLIKILDQTLKLLYEHKTELVYGDLICFGGLHNYRNNGMYIFNGYKIIHLDDLDEYGSLPQEFTVITNNVPILYWVHENKIDENHLAITIQRGVDHNATIWLDISEIKDQCLANIKTEADIVSTNFICNDKIYTIFLTPDPDAEEYDDDPRDANLNNKEKFIKYLTNENILPLEYSDVFDLLGDDEVPENCVFFNLRLYYFKLNMD